MLFPYTKALCYNDVFSYVSAYIIIIHVQQTASFERSDEQSIEKMCINNASCQTKFIDIGGLSKDIEKEVQTSQYCGFILCVMFSRVGVLCSQHYRTH